MDLLIVRSGFYLDKKRQAVIDVINRLWERLEIPEGVRVVTKQTPPLWWAGSHKPYAFLYYRYKAAWDAWKQTPTYFLAITDIDVCPTSRKSLFVLHDFLKSLPPRVGLVTRQTIAGAGFTHPGTLGINPSEGMLVIVHRYIPAFLLSQLVKFLATCAPHQQRGYIYLNEGQIGDLLPPVPTACFPPHVLTMVTGAVDEIPPAAFLHHSGYNYDMRWTVFKLHDII